MNEIDNKNLIHRQPIVVVLGHVDHGKSSILEAIKDFRITAKESGGITQHIGAYEVEHPSAGSGQGGKKITFIDTPGHEAFSAMRSRGAKVADIAILVVAADEGVKPQTKEAISHIKNSGIPMIVALNKIDKPEADPERIKRELVKEDVIVEKMGGKIPSVEVSAKTKKGIPELLEMILLIAEMEDLKADTSKPAEGVIIEAYLDSQRGPIATLILQNGTLKTGDIVGTLSAFGKIKGMENFQGIQLTEAIPGVPVVLLGFEEVPRVGEEIKIFPDIDSARNHIQKKDIQIRQAVVAENGEKKILNLVVKADVVGSLEAIEEVLKTIPQEKVGLRILKAEVGQINESDVKFAKSSGARILGFRVKTDAVATILAERDKIRIMTFDVIYSFVEKIREAMEKSMTSEVVRVELGKVKILAVFMTEKNRQIVGGRVIEGEVKEGASIEVIRNDEVIGKGKLVSLQRNKKEADRVIKGDECGMLYEGDVKVNPGDILLTYIEERRKEL
ncbi:MAG: translation initiation factor IF-2 [Candidatus Nealsonbacteria bacterium CG23_combo_of_CG06-09_8_20_14_all_38_19]|uniref:Translation initiation factor IF-2 n=1 Tax=Candidatus Nealsonbacteria bacterium CG23_combo_of_CG06-09_8_20_14_all_38_19 TaxID=1974721 RepID=A0A2G9YW59_9BACT|nr:MAG: translation initiation factor IF-2 [Candidatus Nealsonbacteria bacterium CG23_combo_of_CG06-09_8_20_14_all_38_19]